MNTNEQHLLILWHNAINHEKRVEKIIEESFTVHSKIKIIWTEEFFSKNLARFYGQSLPSLNGKLKHIGLGNFIAYILNDTDPIYSERNTTSGKKNVNINIFDLKTKLRNITGGGHRIHATNDKNEFHHDLTVLFGPDYRDLLINFKDLFAKNIPCQYIGDTFGLNGWPTIEGLFSYLNATTNYVILRNFNIKESNDLHSDIDILTDSPENFIEASCARKVSGKKYSAQYAVKIGEVCKMVDVRSVTDNYFPEKFAEAILTNRIQNNQCLWTPSKELWVWSLLYHALIHKPFISNDYVIIFKSIWPNIVNTFELRQKLISYLEDNNYVPKPPKDLSVDFYHQPTSNTRRILGAYLLYKEFIRKIVYSAVDVFWSRCYQYFFRCDRDISEVEILFKELNIKRYEPFNLNKWHLGFKYFIISLQGRKYFCKIGPLPLIENEVYVNKILHKHPSFLTPNIKLFYKKKSLALLVTEFIEDAFPITSSSPLTNKDFNNIINFAHFLNSENIIHTDFTPDNIMRTKKGELYFIDFAMSNGPNLNGLNFSPFVNFITKFYLGFGYKPKFFIWNNMYAAKKIVIHSVRTKKYIELW